MNVEDNSFFIKMIDDLVEFSKHDKELNDGIKYIDKQAQEKGISFYEMIYAILFQHDMNQRVNDFVNKHSNTIHSMENLLFEYGRFEINANIYKRHERTRTDEKINAQNDEGI